MRAWGFPLAPQVAAPPLHEASTADQPPERPPAIPLLEPRDGLPPLVTSADALREAVRALGAGEGPVAVDADCDALRRQALGS